MGAARHNDAAASSHRQEASSCRTKSLVYQINKLQRNPRRQKGGRYGRGREVVQREFLKGLQLPGRRLDQMRRPGRRRDPKGLVGFHTPSPDISEPTGPGALSPTRCPKRPGVSAVFHRSGGRFPFGLSQAWASPPFLVPDIDRAGLARSFVHPGVLGQ